MGWIIFGSIVAFLLYKLVISFFIDTAKENKVSYNTLSPHVQKMITSKDAEGLAKLLVDLNLEGRDFERGQILKAINTKGLVFASKVDKHRNRFRKEAGLDPLRTF